MKPTLILFALSLLLTACTTATSDTATHSRLIGAWSLDSRPGKVIEIKSDGTIVAKMNGVETARGTWRVENGYIIQERIQSQTSPTQTETNKVVSVSGDKAVFVSIDGETRLIFHRQ